MSEMWNGILEWTTAYMIFAGILLLGYCGFLVVLLFAGITLRATWHWLCRHSWRDLIVSVEQKAFLRGGISNGH